MINQRWKNARIDPFGKTKNLQPKKLFGMTLKTADEVADDHNKWFEYDSDGDLSEEKVIIAGVTYTKKYHYDANKNITSNSGWIKRIGW